MTQAGNHHVAVPAPCDRTRRRSGGIILDNHSFRQSPSRRLPAVTPAACMQVVWQPAAGRAGPPAASRSREPVSVPPGSRPGSQSVSDSRWTDRRLHQFCLIRCDGWLVSRFTEQTTAHFCHRRRGESLRRYFMICIPSGQIQNKFVVSQTDSYDHKQIRLLSAHQKLI